MKHHSELINFLIKDRQLKSYVEIGTFNRDHNFNLIKCLFKTCVDPDPNAKADCVMTSDQFFSEVPELTADLIFIDGLHYADQVKKDFENALRCLSENGFIVMHDCNPPTEITTCIPRGKQREWCGDVYKFACRLGEYAGIDFRVLDFDYGCAVVWIDKYKEGTPIEGDITWERFQAEKKELLRLVSVEDFMNGH